MKNLLLEKFLTATAAILLLLVVVSIGYDQFGKSHITVTVDLENSQDPFMVIPQMNAPGDIAKITEVDREENEYDIMYRTSKTKPNVLQMVLEYKTVENAHIN